MNNFLLALQFLTIVPVRTKKAENADLARSLIFFPVIGMLLGLALVYLESALASLPLSPLTINILLVTGLAFVTGGIHLDGLADTGDAFLSRKPKEEKLAIMRDPRIGTMGALCMTSGILLKIGLLSSLAGPSRNSAIIAMCALSRWAAVGCIFAFPYARNEGKASAFTKGITLRIFIFSTVITAVLAAVLWQTAGLLVFLIIAGSVYISGKFICRNIGGITGDTIGATIEFSELLVLWCAIITKGGITWTL